MSVEKLIFRSQPHASRIAESNLPLNPLDDGSRARFLRALRLILLALGCVLFNFGCRDAFLPPPEDHPYGQVGADENSDDQPPPDY